jgi:serine/threonine-protein kinase HipA
MFLAYSRIHPMMKKSSTALAGVFLNDRRVGTLGYRDGNTWFEYEDRDPGHPVLGQRFETDPNHRRTASGRVPEWFANLLPEPESGLRQLIGRELGRSNPHDFQVITYIGEDLPGAVRVAPDTNLSIIPELAPRSDSQEDYKVRFSLAGIQPKFSMRWEGKGLVLPMSGQGGNWIVKLPDRRFPDVPANEFSMLHWARLAGINVPETRLLTGSSLSGLPAGMIGDEELAFAIERFDRTATDRIHQEDFAQVREVFPEQKYERTSYSGLARFIRAVCPEDIDEYIRRIACIVIMGNLDAHLKNWTIRYPDKRTPRLSPAYDLVSVSSYPEFHAQELAFAINGSRFANNISSGHIRDFARSASLEPEHVLDIIKSTVAALIDSWAQVKTDCPVPDFVASHIDERLAALTLIRYL